MKLEPLKIGDLVAKIPVIQGGMGIGISLHNLAGNVAKEGGIGILSVAQIGYQNKEKFEKSPLRTNLEAIGEQFKKAKAIAKDGIVGFNVMVAQFHYDKYIKKCVEAGADVIISGAGLPVDLPKFVGDSKTKIAPIVSSAKAAKVILRTWAKRYNRTADFVVIEGPKAGGHLGFKKDQIEAAIETMDNEVTQIIEVVKKYGSDFNVHVPVVFAGGVFTREDIDHYLALGCEGVQMATRFVGTVECDAPDDFKDKYLKAKKEDIQITKSPVGLPGRAIKNSFIERINREDIPIEKCRACLSFKHCDRKTIPYCISEALLHSVEGNAENGLVFAGANAYRVNEITTVKAILEELNQ
ncbi:MAG: nitronate monooxygenase family protein [Streptococcaceae bacterium]|jgi:NAD(P)H-dependent flavin oxidoreductase YrpB (nitropropane dioxygenase family)|nr:nitronate monooxygenase family protein [Streptococcaceae bacterium]MCH4176002.1 nitronate monooxygenase family protein [Streptococcaceae bacterium]